VFGSFGDDTGLGSLPIRLKLSSYIYNQTKDRKHNTKFEEEAGLEGWLTVNSK